MSRLLFIGLVATVLAGLVVGDALAQRDAGAKARGEFGSGFWGQAETLRGYPAGPSFYQSAPAAESYRSFSYQPLDIAAGDAVVVNVERADLMLGPTRLGSLDRGESFRVVRIVNGWLGTVVEQDGEELRGWIWHRHVTPEAFPERQAAPQQIYRRFSYEPLATPGVTPPATRRGPAVQPAPPEVRLRPGSRSY